MNAQAEKGPHEFKYWAFLSYSHTDKKWGDWLHKALETYRVPRRLVGKESRDGKVPPRVFPIFRDREELPVSADLGSNINEALQESRYLIVICSPRAAQSRWVAEEIKTFKKLGRENRILALIVDGEPNASDGKAGFAVQDECFPAPMRYRLAESGELSQERTEPIAADARESGDGRNNAKLKLLAGLLGVSYDDLKRRDQDRRLRRARAIGAAALVLVLIFAALAVALFYKEREAQRERAAAVNAEQQTRLRASKADADIGLQLAEEGDEASAFAHAVRALELNSDNKIAAILAYRLLGDGPLTLPTHLLSHTSAIRALAFSRDGRRIATGCDDGSLMVTDLDTNERFTLAEKLVASVVKLAFSPDGESLAFATGSEAAQDPAVHTWDYRSLQKPVLVSKDFSYDILELAWPLKDRIAAYSGRDWGSGDQLTQVFGLTREGWHVVFGISDGLISRTDVAKTIEPLVRPQGKSRPRVVIIPSFQTWVTEQSAFLIIHDREKRRLSWYDLRGPFDINKPLFAVDTVDGDIIDIAQQNGIAIIGTNFTNKLEWRRGQVGISDPERNSALKWADPRSHNQGSIPLPPNTLLDRISANGERLLALDLRGAVILDRRTGAQIGALQMKKSDQDDVLAFSEDGTTLVARAEPNRIVTGEFGKDKTAFANYVRADDRVFGSGVAVPTRVAGAGLEPSARWLAAWTDDKNVRIWSLAALRARPLCLSGGTPKSEQWGPMHQPDDVHSPYQLNIRKEAENVDKLDVCRLDPSTNQCVYLSTLQEPKAQDPGSGMGVTGHSFSPDGNRVVVTYGSWSSRPDNNASSVGVLFDTATGRVIGKPLKHDDDVFSPCYAPNGKWFVTISDDRTLRRWDGATGVAMGEPIRLPKARRFARVSPNSDVILTGTGHIIDAAKWTVIKKLEPEPVALDHAFFSPDGLWLATVSRVWQPSDESPYLIELSQWDLQNAVKISDLLEVPVAEYSGDTSASWLERGLRVAIGSDLVWQCSFSCPAKELLPFLRACRPLIMSETGEQIINNDCSLDSVNLKSFFPQGRTEQNQAAYDFAERVLGRGSPIIR